MKPILFASDLDNTLLFSYKHRREGDLCVELLEGKEQTFVTPDTPARLQRLRENLLFIPVTSRSVQQYLRITLPPPCVPAYAVTTNGGILLVDGQVDPLWRRESLELIQPWWPELQRIHGMLAESQSAERFRIVDELFLFAACDTPADAQACGDRYEGHTTLDVAVSGRKVYFFPPPLSKGAAIRRLKQRFSFQTILCAGDTVIDSSMLALADVAIAPDPVLLRANSAQRQCIWDGSGRFSDYVLSQALAAAHLDPPTL